MNQLVVNVPSRELPIPFLSWNDRTVSWWALSGLRCSCSSGDQIFWWEFVGRHCYRPLCPAAWSAFVWSARHNWVALQSVVNVSLAAELPVNLHKYDEKRCGVVGGTDIFTWIVSVVVEQRRFGTCGITDTFPEQIKWSEGRLISKCFSYSFYSEKFHCAAIHCVGIMFCCEMSHWQLLACVCPYQKSNLVFIGF